MLHPREYREFEYDPFHYTPPEGEPASECLQRARDWLSNLESGTALVVSHKTWMRLLITDLLSADPIRYREALDVKIASMSVLVHVANRWRLEALNYGASAKRIIGN